MSNVKALTGKKLFGTAFFALFVLGLALSTSSVVQALFINTKTTFIVDGVVVSTGVNRITIDTAGAKNITVDTNDKTKFIPNGLALDDLISGDLIHITAKTRQGDNALARVVKLIGNGPGYGTQGDPVLTANATVMDIDITGNTGTFTVTTGSAVVTFEVLSDTSFIHKGGLLTFADLDIGNKVLVQGEDNTTGFIARNVIIKKK